MREIEFQNVCMSMVEIDLIIVFGSELTCFLRGVEKCLLAAGSKLTWFLCRSIEIDFMSEWVSN